MTVETTTARVTYTGAGTTGPFSVPFYFLEDDDLTVIKTTIADGTETTLVLTTDYTVSGAADEAGGSVTLTASLSSAYKLTIIRDPDLLQSSDYPPNDKFPATTHERVVDKLTMIAQRLKDLINRSFRLSDGDVSGVSLSLSNLSASKLIAVNSAGTALEAVAAADVGLTPVSGFAATLLDDADAATARATLGAAGLGANTFTGLQQLAYLTTIASGATVDLGTATSNSVSVTHSSGTTAITSFGGASLQRGTTILVTPTITGGTLTITHHATDLILPGSSNITLASGDRLLMQKLSSSLAQWWLVGGVKADGTAWVKTPVSSTSVTFTRDMTTATGTQAVTGVGFTPTAIIFVYAISGTTQEGVGFADSSKTGRNRNYLTPTGWFVGPQAIAASTSSGNYQIGDVSTYDSDGFTISWTKAGSPTGTLTVHALCFR